MGLRSPHFVLTEHTLVYLDLCLALGSMMRMACAYVRQVVHRACALSCHIWSCHILSGRTKYDCNIWSGQNMTTNLLVIFRPPLQYFVRPTNYILRLPYHAWDHRISHSCKGRRNRSEFVIIFCPDQILQSYLVLADKLFLMKYWS